MLLLVGIVTVCLLGQQANANLYFGGDITLAEGQRIYISSTPNITGSYSNNADLIWRITVPPMCGLNFHILDFETQETNDVVEYGEGSDVSAMRIGEFTGQVPAQSLVVAYTFSTLWIRFTSDAAGVNRGFLAEMTALCSEEYLDSGGNFTLPQNGSLYITSPNYPGSYGNDLDTIWRFTVPDMCNLNFHILYFVTLLPDTLEYGAGSNVSDGRIRGFNGSVSALSLLVDTDVRTTWMRFTSDSADMGPGFQAEMTVLCPIMPIGTGNYYSAGQGRSFTLSPGERIYISTPNYPNDYSNNLDIVWRLSVPVRCALNFHIIDFVTQQNNDKVEFGGGSDVSTGKIGEFTGPVPPSNVATNFTTFWMRFTSDAADMERGFLAEMTVLCPADPTMPTSGGMTIQPSGAAFFLMVLFLFGRLF